MTGASWQPPGADVLTDPRALQAADRCGLLPALATAGAQLRSLAEQLAGAAFDRPRSLIVVDPAHTGDGDLAAALLARPRVPVLSAPALPDWAGALDLAVVLAATPDDEPAARAAAEANRRGVRLVVRGAEHGPVADAAGAALLAPRIAVPELAAGAARLAVLLAVIRAADIDAGAPEPDSGSAAWHAVADALDAEALACGPGAEPFVNPSVALALRLIDGPGLFLAEDPAGLALARRCARAVRLLGGRPAAAQHVSGLLPGGQLTAVLTRPSDPFADPDSGGTDPAALVPVLVPAPTPVRGPAGMLAAVGRALPRAMVLAADEPDAGPVTVALTLALRVEFAAACLGIAAGQVPPADGPDGLGPAGGTRDVRPATTVEDVTSDYGDDPGGRPWS